MKNERWHENISKKPKEFSINQSPNPITVSTAQWTFNVIELFIYFLCPRDTMTTMKPKR